MNIRSKYAIGDSVFIVQYHQLLGRFCCKDYKIKYIVFDGSEITYGFNYDISEVENLCYEDKLTANRMCEFLNRYLEWEDGE